MNKQQLANKIWESANRMRSKIEANEYKDYILGFIFYKFLSDKEVEFLKNDGYEDDDIKENVHENNESLVDYCQQHLGYFIAYDNLFSTWLAKGSSFTVDNVRTALSAFNRLISETQKKVFSKIFNTLETGLSTLIPPMLQKHGISTPPCLEVFLTTKLTFWLPIGPRFRSCGEACSRRMKRPILN